MSPIAAVVLMSLAGGFQWPGAAAVEARDLASQDQEKKRAAVERVARLDGAAAADVLRPLLADPDTAIRTTAGRALARMGDAEALAAAVRWLASPGAQERPAGLQVLREAARLTPAARSAVERALTDSELGVRLQALDVLALHQPSSSVAALSAAVDDEAGPVRVRAIQVLEQAHDARAVLPLLGRLGDIDRSVRIEAIRVLGTLDDARAGPALRRILTEGSDDVRIGAATALGRLKIAAAAPALAVLARQRPANDVARHAQLALGAIGTPEAVGVLADLLREPSEGDVLREALVRAGAAAVPRLIAELGSTAAEGGASAIHAAGVLGRIGDRRATRPLAEVVQRRAPAAPSALVALAEIADPGAVPALVQATTDASSEVRRLAFDALAAIRDDRAVVALPRGLGDADPGVRRRAAALAGIILARSSTDALVARIGDADADVRREAIRALGGLGAPEATPALLAALEAGARDQAEVAAALEATARPAHAAALAQAVRRLAGARRAAALDALAAAMADAAAIPDGVVDTLLDVIREDGAVGEAAADALSAVAVPPDRAPALLRAFDAAEPATRARLCTALASTGTPAGFERLGRALDDDEEDEAVRASAAWASAIGLAHPAQAGLVRERLSRAARSPLRALSANAEAALAAGAAAQRPGEKAERAWAGVRLVAGDGAVLTHTWVRLRLPGGAALSAMTGGGGTARFYGLPPGPYRIETDDARLVVGAAATPAGFPTSRQVR